ncbi:MAG: hypothetical protein GEU90_08360 [Gemmatimonas sp.]|nr:hypothetical protein [Gemmatimonas sp.]
MTQTLDLDIRLGGHSPVAGSMMAQRRSTGERATRAAGFLILFLFIGAGVVFIPPHIPWAAVAIVTGVVLAFKQWRSEYRVQQFDGKCPRCGTELPVKSEEGVRFPLKVTCFECHHEPVVTIRD